MSAIFTKEIDYPSSDGKPMAETPFHMRVMIDLIEILKAWFADPMVYVWGNMFLYFVQGNPRKNVSPDVFVAKGVERDKPRDVNKLWEEGKAPDLVIEVTSKKTKKQDRGEKFQIYQDILKVPEYILFDPKGDYLKPPLQGYRLVRGVYQPIPLEKGRLPSEVLGLHLEADGERLRVYDPAQKVYLLNNEEARREAEAKIERLRRENEELRRQLGKKAR
jgi:Uma2 family endonuclease